MLEFAELTEFVDRRRREWDFDLEGDFSDLFPEISCRPLTAPSSLRPDRISGDKPSSLLTLENHVFRRALFLFESFGSSMMDFGGTSVDEDNGNDLVVNWSSEWDVVIIGGSGDDDEMSGTGADAVEKASLAMSGGVPNGVERE